MRCDMVRTVPKGQLNLLRDIVDRVECKHRDKTEDYRPVHVFDEDPQHYGRYNRRYDCEQDKAGRGGGQKSALQW